MSVNSINKTIQFDHVKGTIKSDGELASFIKEDNTWKKINEKFYRFQNLKVVPNAWGMNSYSEGDCVQYQNRYFLCKRPNNGSDTSILLQNNTVNDAFWYEYTYLLSNITGKAILGEYVDYYNYCLYSENLNKNVSMYDILNKTQGNRKLIGKELNEYLKNLKNTPWITNSLVVQESDSLLKEEKSWILKTGVQTNISEHDIEQEITELNPNNIFCLTAYAKMKESFRLGMGVSLQADSGVVNYVVFFNLYDGSIIDLKWYDEKYNELFVDPNVLENISYTTEKIYEEDNVYRLSFTAKIKSNSYQPKMKIKFFIPSDNMEIKYIAERELSVYLNNIQIVKQHDFLESNENPYMYLPTYDKPTKSEYRTKKYKRNLNGTIDVLDAEYVIDDNIPNVKNYNDGDYCFICSPVDFVNSLKLGELLSDPQTNTDKTLTYYKSDVSEYHMIKRHKKYRLLTSKENKWKSRLFNAFVFNKYGYYRNAGQQFRHHG